MFAGSADFLALNYYTSIMVRPPNFNGRRDILFSDISADAPANKSWAPSGIKNGPYQVPEGLRAVLK